MTEGWFDGILVGCFEGCVLGWDDGCDEGTNNSTRLNRLTRLLPESLTYKLPIVSMINATGEFKAVLVASKLF